MILAQLLGQRIDVGPGLLHREMEMRSGREPGRTDVADKLPDTNVAARLHSGRDLGQVAVDADHLVLMLEANAIAQLALPSGALHLAVRDSFDRLAIFGDQVNADVGAIGVENRMIAMEREAGGNVLEVEREAQELRTECVSLFVIQVGTAVLVQERDCGQRTAPKTDLRRLDVADQRVGAVAADLYLVDQFDCGAGCETLQVMSIRERILERLDDWLGYIVLGRRTLEAVLDRERHLDRPDEIFDGAERRFEHAGTETRLGDSGVGVEIVPEAAHLAGLGIFVEGQRMTAVKISVRGDALNVGGPLVSVVPLHP